MPEADSWWKKPYPCEYACHFDWYVLPTQFQCMTTTYSITDSIGHETVTLVTVGRAALHARTCIADSPVEYNNFMSSKNGANNTNI